VLVTNFYYVPIYKRRYKSIYECIHLEIINKKSWKSLDSLVLRLSFNRIAASIRETRSYRS